MAGELLTGAQALIARREDRIRQLERELAEKDQVIADAERHNVRAVGNLRRQLSPLYRALQQVFGEIDSVAPDDAPYGAVSSSGADARTQAIWDSWKRKMGAASPVIDALLLQPGMTQTQIGIAIGRARSTVPALIYKLKNAGLIVKDGDRYSLKAL